MKSHGSSIIVAGTRTFDDYPLLATWLDVLRVFYGDIVIISGSAPGADRLAETYAERNEIPIKLYPANWKEHSRAAGPLRNQQMCEVGDVLLAFWDGKSQGTDNMVHLAKAKGIPIHLVMY